MHQDFKVSRIAHSLQIAYPDIKLSARDGYRDLEEYVITAFRDFAIGDQIRTEGEVNRRVEKVMLVPVSPGDWLKKLITDWEPTLCFGWLKPKVKRVETVVTVTNHAKIYNVYPVSSESEDRKYIRIADNVIPKISALDWLNATPPTMAEVREQRERLEASDCAKYMAAVQYLRSQNAKRSETTKSIG